MAMKLQDFMDRVSAQLEAIQAAIHKRPIPRHINEWEPKRRKKWLTWYYEFLSREKGRK